MSDPNMMHSPDWNKHVLDLPMRDAPGTRWGYNSVCSMLLSDILYRATGRPVDDFAQQYLFEPIGLDNWRWSLGRNDVINTAQGLSICAPTWRGSAPCSFITVSGRADGSCPRVGETADCLKTQANAGQFPYAHAYPWWRMQNAEPTAAMLETHDIYPAIGLHGQFVLVIPRPDMVAVSTAENIGWAKEEQYSELLRDHVLPAVRR